MNLVLNTNNKLNTLQITDEINYFRKLEGKITIDPITGKEKGKLAHYDLLKIVRIELARDINEGNISGVDYKDKKGENRTMYELDIKQSKRILLRESVIIRELVVEKIEELESKLNGNFKVPTTMLEAMQLATKTLEVNEALEAEKLKLEVKVKEDKPKVNYANAMLASVDCLDVKDFDTATFKMGRNTLFAKLRELKYLNKDNKPYANYVKVSKYFQVKTSTYMKKGVVHTSQKLMITPKGQKHLVNILPSRM